MNIHEAFAAYDIDRLYASGKSAKTRRNYRSTLNSFIKVVGDELPVQFIAYEHILQWKVQMEHDGFQSSSMATNLSALRNVLRYLRERRIDVLDYKDIVRPKVKAKAPTWLTMREISQFLETIDSLRDKALFACLFDSAARISELLSLNRGSIVSGEAEILGKGDKPGRLFFDSSLPILQQYLDTRTDKLRPLFISGQRRRITVSRVEQLAHEYADMAGLDKNVTPHVFRHSRASDYKLNGADIFDIQKQLRHSSISTTQIYTHIGQDKVKEDHKRFGSTLPLA